MIEFLKRIFRRATDPVRRVVDPEWEPGPWPFARGEPVEVEQLDERALPAYRVLYYPARVIRCVHTKAGWTVEVAYEIDSQYWPQTICPAGIVRSLDIVRSLGRLA